MGTRRATDPRMTSHGSSVLTHTRTKSKRPLEKEEPLVPLSPRSSTFGNAPLSLLSEERKLSSSSWPRRPRWPGRAVVPVLHIQHVPPRAQGLRAGAPRAAAVLDPLQDAINVFQPIFLKAPKPCINHRPHSTLSITTDNHVIHFDKEQLSHC